MRRRSNRFPAAFALAFAAACARAPEALPPGRIELAELALSARLWVEEGSLDFGLPAARAALWSGWGADETSPAGATFVWGHGASSLLRFDVAEPRDLEARLRGWSYPFADGGGQEVEIRLNGESLGRRELGADPATLELAITGRQLARGENFLELVYARRAAGEDGIERAAAWDGIRLEGAASSAGRPAIDAAAGTLVLPAGSGATWTLELPAGAFLAFDRAIAEGGAELAVESRAGEGGESRRLTPGATSLRLTESGGGGALATAQVVLAAGGSGGAARIEGLRIQIPRGSEEAPPPGPAQAAPAATLSRPNLVVYLIDTLRADRLGCYGYERATSPRIDRFAAEGWLFREGRAQSSWTRPAVATILSGLEPWAHGVEERSSALPEAVATVAERLAAAGYETALFTTNANIVARFGFAQGWESFEAIFERAGRKRRHVDSSEIHRHVVDWLAARERRGERRPFLLFVHTLDPHDPYRPAEPYRRALAGDVDVEAACCFGADGMIRRGAADPAFGRAHAAAASRLYDAEVAQNDAAFGALLDELERRRLAATTAVLLTSDHGEEFFEHGGWKHGYTLHEELLRIPLILRLPGAAPRAIDVPAEQIDVAPTLLALAGAPDPKLPGTSLLALALGKGAARTSTARLVRAGVVLESAKSSGWKLIRRHGPRVPPLAEPPYALFDLARDSGELADLALSRPLERALLEGRIERALRGVAAFAGERVAIDPELDRQLKALGYL